MIKRLLPAALALAFSATAFAAGPLLKGASSAGWYRMPLGDFEVTALSDGTVDLPVDKLLQQPVPNTLKALQHAYLGVPLETSVNAYLVNTGPKLVLVDTGAAAIFSWLDTANSAPQKFFESVLRGRDKTSAILHAVLDNIENVAFAPVWYESLTQEQRDYIFSRMILFEASMTYSEGGRPDDAAPKLDTWGEANVAPF